ncbi:hypothetical protein [Portibacter lacus]|uniref:Uncharacterized protein n=1 Tax=Portibacter lacus TaxID=1099794 RepID=A0AA37WG44_9BACT|nr:hypothetical protein [Portibacter lacus]GLR19468.1 hypothetical protein GCM10007940_40840 [Portibacter lacus]
MHDIEPYYKWRDQYIASEDRKSPFFGRDYSEFTFTKKIYNYYIHPQWDEFGSHTIYMKILYVDYNLGYCHIELIGEWNDCLHNDIMFIKREIADHLYQNGIRKFTLFCDNVLNFHGSDNSYYEEWLDDIAEDGGWICLVNTQDHVEMEMENAELQYYVNFGGIWNDISWQGKKPENLQLMIEGLMSQSAKGLSY